MPPLVSQSTTTSAPASAAARTASSAYAGFSRYPSKKCSQSTKTRWPSARRCRTVSEIIARFSARVVRSACSTCRSWLLATMQAMGARESRTAAVIGSSAAFIPTRRVKPKATSSAFRNRRAPSAMAAKKEVSFGLAPGQPPSMNPTPSSSSKRRNRELVRHGEVETLLLRTVAQRGVEDMKLGGFRP